MAPRKQAPTAHQKALQLQKRIFNALKTETVMILGKTPHDIDRYDKETRTDFKISRKQSSSLTSLSKSDLIEKVRESDVTFIGDFHTFDQAQRTALRIIRDAVIRENSERPWIIGLEMISSQFQPEVDQFQAGKISVEEFHKSILYQEEWGFPWSNYAPIFEWAKENQVKIVALNLPRPLLQFTHSDELSKRDEWAAAILTDLFKNTGNMRPRVIALYGELHVGSKHLPAQLTRISKSVLRTPLSWITLHQNEASVYWKLAEHSLELQTEALRLKKNVYCIFSSTPWAKLQSLVNWMDGELSDTSDPDYLSLLSHLGATLSQFLEIPCPSYGAITLCTIKESSILNSLYRDKRFSRNELKLIRFHVHQNLRFFIPRADIAYLGSPSQNGAAELAAIHLFRIHSESPVLFLETVDDFFKLTLEAIFGFFGSLILNPRRKCDLPADHQQRLEKLKNPATRTHFPFERESREMTLELLSSEYSRGLDNPSLLHRFFQTHKMTSALIMSSKFLGQILGTRLHQAILTEKLGLSRVRTLFLKRLESEETYESRFYGLLQDLSFVPIPISKNEHL